MKKIFSIASLLLVSNFLFAQWNSTSNVPHMYNTNTGNVGIGTATPAYNLDVSNAGNSTLRIGTTTAGTGYSNLLFRGILNQWKISKSPSTNSGPSQSSTLDFTYFNGVNSGDQQLMTLYNSGSNALCVIMGAYSPSMVSSSYKLIVEGKIGARELVISNATPFPDYVFGQNYYLRSLPEIEKYIKQYGHLPEIPSAEDVKKNGLEVGAMTTILVQKVEELTLYIIELKKENEEITKKLNKLSEK